MSKLYSIKRIVNIFYKFISKDKEKIKQIFFFNVLIIDNDQMLEITSRSLPSNV